MVEGFPGELVEHIGLVFLSVKGPGQTAAAVFVGQNPGVVAGGDVLAAETGGNISQLAELYVTVAENAGVGSQSRPVLPEEGLDNLCGKFFSQVGCMVADAENIADPAGVVQGGGGFSRLSRHRPVFVCEYQGYAGHFIALLLQQGGGDGAVHAAGHGHGDFRLFWHDIRFLFCQFYKINGNMATEKFTRREKGAIISGNVTKKIFYWISGKGEKYGD